MKTSKFRAILSCLLPCLITWCLVTRANAQQKPAAALLHPESYHHYFTEFAEQEQRVSEGPTGSSRGRGLSRIFPGSMSRTRIWSKSTTSAGTPFKSTSDHTPDGFIIDEFLDDVPWAGKYNSIDAAAADHLKEARWLRDPAYADQYARFWFSPDGEPRRYSFAAADAIYSVYLANGDKGLVTGLLPALVSNYEAWEKTHQDPNGLFWQIDDRDGMEDSIGGSGYRPTINSYMYGDAVAISRIAALSGDKALSEQYATKAEKLRPLMEDRLWDPDAEFYETVPRESGATWVGVREEIGYVPWYFDLPHADHVVAWKQLTDPQGFLAKYGPTTAERRSPRFRFEYPHECLWNGPSWPFATTQTLVALANLLNGAPQNNHWAEENTGTYSLPTCAPSISGPRLAKSYRGSTKTSTPIRASGSRAPYSRRRSSRRPIVGATTIIPDLPIWLLPGCLDCAPARGMH